MKKTLPESSFEITNCRVCDSTNIRKVIDLGVQPVANNLVKWPSTKEPKYPLNSVFCGDCNTFQLGYTVDKKELFSSYNYRSSVSPVFIQHMADLSHLIKAKYNPAYVVELGSNDGILLNELTKDHIRCTGIEPAYNMVSICKRKGFEMVYSWFEAPACGKNFISRNGKADVVVACNVFAHIHNLKAVMKNAKQIMKDDGVMIVEVAHLLKLIENNYFDTIYHEHFFNWSLMAFIELADRVGLYVDHVDEIPTHGGSLRIFLKKQVEYAEADDYGMPDQSVIDILGKEFEAGLNDVRTYIKFNEKVRTARERLMKILFDIRSQGKRIVGYGAPAKASTLMNYFGIGFEHLDYIIDDAEAKQGMFTPGNHIEIKAMPEQITQDYVLVLAWNFADQIIDKVKATGYTGQFIVPFPEPTIV